MDDMMYLSADDNDVMYLGADNNGVMSLSADEDDMGYLAADDEAGMEMDDGDITPAERKAIKENSKARHTHNNKDVIDGITAEEVKKWNSYKEYDDTKIKESLNNKVNKDLSNVSDSVFKQKAEQAGVGTNAEIDDTELKLRDEKLKYYGDPDIEITDESLFAFDSDSGTISKYKGNENIVVIPYKINGYDVKIIGEHAFSFKDNLINIIIPNSVISLSDCAFNYCASLENVTIPDSVTSIGNKTFLGCSSLTSITIGNSVTSIGSEAFASCQNLTNVVLPDGITNISKYLFYDCKSLTTIKFPDCVKSIGESAFYNCALTSITIPNGVVTIGRSAFSNCVCLTTIKIPDSVTLIDAGAFYNCYNVVNVTIPYSVTSILENAFKYIPNAKFYVYQGSYAEEWCKTNAKLFAYIGINDLEINYTESELGLSVVDGLICQTYEEG